MINYSIIVKNARLQKVIDAIDAQASPGAIKIYTAGGATLLSTIPLNKPSFSAPAGGGAMALSGTPISDTNAANTGNAALARICDGNGALVVDGLTVGTANTDIVLGTVTINAGDEVILNSGVITHG